MFGKRYIVSKENKDEKKKQGMKRENEENDRRWKKVVRKRRMERTYGDEKDEGKENMRKC